MHITAASHNGWSVFLCPFCRRGKGRPEKQNHELGLISGGAGVQTQALLTLLQGPRGHSPEHVPEHTPHTLQAASRWPALLSEPGPSPRRTRSTGCNPGGVTGLHAQKGAPHLGSKLCSCRLNHFIAGLVFWK